jgi:hypothetical protein
MAKVYTIPDELLESFHSLVAKANDWNERDYRVRRGHESAAVALLADLIRRERPDLADDTTGKIFRTPMADGYAQYCVVSSKGSGHLIHLPFGDAWEAHPALIRGLRGAEIRFYVTRPSFADLCAEADAIESGETL